MQRSDFSCAQQSTVPTLVNFTGALTDANGKPFSVTVGVTFSLYKDQQGGSPLWMETQNVTPDKSGHYSVMLGSTNSHGLPVELFASGEARWLGVQAQGQAEQPRVLLLSVPYALKAGDAQTVGGLPPSAFVLAAPPNAASSTPSSSGSNPNSNPPALGGSGQANYIPLWTNSTTLGSSVLFQSGAGAKAKVGIGTAKPASTLDVKGGGTIRGLFSLPATGTATATGGFNSQPMNLVTSAFNSGTSTAVPQTFQWQAQPVGNNTNNATGSLNLLFAQGNGKPAETGLNIASNGQITFATGQTFPGTGTITGVTAGTGLTGGGNSGNVSLSVPNNGITNALLQNSSLTVNPGGGMTGGGKISLGGSATLGLQNCSANQVLEFVSGVWTCMNAGSGTITGVTAGSDLTGGGNSGNVTLNLDTTKVPQLNAANTFTGNQTINGNLTDNGAIATSGISTSTTGGLFINSATSGASSGALGISQSPAGYGVYGIDEATGGYGVYGQSYGGTGVSGNDTSGTGVSGNTTSGTGVYGNSTSGIGVSGVSSGNNAVQGFAHTTGGSGVAGFNDVQDATGVYGSNQNGYGFVTDSHVSQGRSMGGWVKAMAFIDFSGTIHRCFNSQLNGSAASVPPCGINLSVYHSTNPFQWVVDFGFEVDDRFVQASFMCACGDTAYGLSSDGSFTGDPTLASTPVWVEEDSGLPFGFYVFVY